MEGGANVTFGMCVLSLDVYKKWPQVALSLRFGNEKDIWSSFPG